MFTSMKMKISEYSKRQKEQKKRMQKERFNNDKEQVLDNRKGVEVIH